MKLLLINFRDGNALVSYYIIRNKFHYIYINGIGG